MAKLCKIVISNPFQTSPSSAILCALQSSLWCFSSLENCYFQVSQPFNRNLGRQRNDSKYRDVGPFK